VLDFQLVLYFSPLFSFALLLLLDGLHDLELSGEGVGLLLLLLVERLQVFLGLDKLLLN
jgi:hypothetical protein